MSLCAEEQRGSRRQSSRHATMPSVAHGRGQNGRVSVRREQRGCTKMRLKGKGREARTEGRVDQVWLLLVLLQDLCGTKSQGEGRMDKD